MYRSTPQSRLAARDYWTRPDVARVCKSIDWAMALMLMTGLFLLGSINL